MAGVLILMAVSTAGTALTQPQGGADRAQTLNYRDADIQAFIEDVAMATGRSFIFGPQVQGKVTVISERPVEPEAIFQIFLSTLRAHGFTALPTASGAHKIVREDLAAQDGQPVEPARKISGDRFVTEVFHLDNVEAAAAMRALKPIVGQQGRILAEQDNDFLIAVDYAANIARLREVITEIDVDRSIARTIELKNLSAEEMADIVAELVGESRDTRGGRPPVRLVPVKSGNSLVLRGPPERVSALLPTIAEIDAKSAARGSIRVFYLEHATAEQMAPLLNEVSRSIGPGSGSEENASRASIAVHADTNALVVSAEPEMLRALESVIGQLDRPRAQVLVEAIIVEITDDAARELGLQYVLSGSRGSDIPFSATNFSQAAPDIIAATGALAVGEETSGDSDVLGSLQQAAINSLLGVSGFASGFAGLTDGGTLFGVILTALEQDVGSNVLSTPHVLTMDNAPASINVGQEVPITTGEVVGANLENPFRTVERRDVGVQLEVVPQINAGDTVRLEIRQEVSSVLGPAAGSVNDLVFNTRELSTTVNVKSGEILVLGGLIEEDEQVSLQKVPLLGDIPGLGRLFRSEAKSRVKTNLVIFIRPTIVRDEATARRLTERKYNYIRAEQLIQPNASEVPALDRFMQEVIGETPAKRPGGDND